MSSTIELDQLDVELGTARRPYGVVFGRTVPVVSAPHRADIACFVGYVARREPGTGSAAEPIDGWDEFARLFDWAARPVAGSRQTVSTFLGAAVRSFFAQGGRRCYVVPVADPWPVETGALLAPPLTKDEQEARLAERKARIAERIGRLIPGYPKGFDASPADERSTWRGMAQLFALPDVSFVCFPDLADIVAVAPKPADEPKLEPADIPERFVECAEDARPAPADGIGRRLPLPLCDEDGYVAWVNAIGLATGVLSRHLPEMELVAAVPIPEERSSPPADLILDWPNGFRYDPAFRPPDELPPRIGSAFVQLVYPWVRTPGSANLPGGLESPDGVLAGLLAHAALTRGAFRSAANAGLADVTEVAPPLRRADLLRHNGPGSSLLERVSLLGPTPGGLRLLSDVTTSLDPNHRPACIGRLTASLFRAARILGEETTFEPNGERLWSHLRDRLNGLLGRLFDAGALRGRTASEAFAVRCDRSTMTQRDLDEGRVIATVQFSPAAPVERIMVVLTMNDGGGLSLAPAGGTG